MPIIAPYVLPRRQATPGMMALVLRGGVRIGGDIVVMHIPHRTPKAISTIIVHLSIQQ